MGAWQSSRSPGIGADLCLQYLAQLAPHVMACGACWNAPAGGPSATQLLWEGGDSYGSVFRQSSFQFP